MSYPWDREDGSPVPPGDAALAPEEAALKCEEYAKIQIDNADRALEYEDRFTAECFETVWREAAAMLRDLAGRPQADAPGAPPEAISEIERLKAENASLMESLRAAREDRDSWLTEYQKRFKQFEERAAAAEQRNTELKGALRELLDSDVIVEMDANAVAAARAALHDEERSAPPEEEDGK